MSSLPMTPVDHWPAVPGDAGFIERLTDVDLGRCVQDLAVAVFRRAVADLVAKPASRRAKRRVRERVEMRRIDAEDFLSSRHSAALAEMIGVSPASLRYQLAHLRHGKDQRCPRFENEVR